MLIHFFILPLITYSITNRLKEIMNTNMDIDVKDCQSVIDCVEGWLVHGHGLCQRVAVYCNVASTLDLKYEYVVDHSRPICVLKMLLEMRNHSGACSLAIGANLNLARSWIAVSRISPADVVALVQHELVDAAQAAYDQVNGSETSMVVSLLRGQFNRLVTFLLFTETIGMCGMKT